jgi:aromatic ring-opening dioxygenase catalytic subunit (LigB family)
MAKIVGAFGVPHNPHFPSWSQEGHPLGEEIDRYYGRVAEQLRAVQPDAIVYFTSDHYNLFFESVPIFSIAVAPSASGPSDYPTIARRELPIASELARTVQRHVMACNFDVGMLQELEFDHTVIAPLHFLLPDRDIPLVPVYISAFLRPIPSARRCYALGQAIREAIEAADGVERVAVIASGSFSVEIGGPRLAPDSHVGVPDPTWTQRVVELLEAGGFTRLVDEATDEQMREAGNAAGELLDWIAMLGMIDPAPPTFVETQPQFGHAFAAWPIDPAVEGSLEASAAGADAAEASR